jgi:hypothetical protein
VAQNRSALPVFRDLILDDVLIVFNHFGEETPGSFFPLVPDDKGRSAYSVLGLRPHISAESWGAESVRSPNCREAASRRDRIVATPFACAARIAVLGTQSDSRRARTGMRLGFNRTTAGVPNRDGRFSAMEVLPRVV